MSVDAILLDQALANVVENALRYAPGAPIRVTAAAEADAVQLTIEDAGGGVPEEALPRLFDKFYRVRRPRDAAAGTGIGLAVVRGLLQAMGGDARATRAELGGLAIVMRPPPRNFPEAAVPGLMAAGARVLLVEDDQETRRSLARSLLAHGYQVDEASDGAEAARRWEARRPT